LGRGIAGEAETAWLRALKPAVPLVFRWPKGAQGRIIFCVSPATCCGHLRRVRAYSPVNPLGEGYSGLACGRATLV
jgi:hypothetical protein